jgi:hypothetical protein
MQLGSAEVHAGLARLAAAEGDPATAAQSLSTALALYESVLQDPVKIGGFRERCEVRCVATLLPCCCIWYLYLLSHGFSGRVAPTCHILSQLQGIFAQAVKSLPTIIRKKGLV